jgi:hypothetical protein
MDMKLSEIDFLQVHNMWKSDLDSFKCFFRPANFVSLKHYTDFQLDEVPETGGNYFNLISGYIDKCKIEETLFIIDITGTEAIRTAFFIRRIHSLAPVLVFNGVLHPFGLIGDRGYISNLIGYGLMLEAIDKKGYLIVLDHDRFGEYTDDEMRENFNNQYELGEEDLPPVEQLCALGYKNITYFYEKTEKEDIECYLEYLMQNEITVEKINIADPCSFSPQI